MSRKVWIDLAPSRVKLGILSFECLYLTASNSYIGGTLIEGGIDTSTSMLQMLVMVLSCHPEVQRKAQEEIDHTIGDRIPRLDDIKNLSYIQAIIKEVVLSTYTARGTVSSCSN